MDVRLPNGTVIKNIPEGTTREQLYEKLQNTEYADAFGDWTPTPTEDPVPETWSENVAQAELQSIDPVIGAAGDALLYGADAASNIPRSVMNMASGLASAIMNPVDTAESVLRTGLGAEERGIRAITGGEPGENEPYFNALIDYYGDRYGGGDNILETIRTDPAGFLMDVVPVAGLAGKATAINPLTGPAKALTGPADDIARNIRRSEFFEDVKPSTRLGGDPRRADIVREELWRTADDYGIDPTGRGLEKVRDNMRAIDSRVDDLISGVDDVTPASKLLDGLDSTRARAGANLSTGADDLVAAQKVEDRITRSIQSSRGAFDDAGVPRNPYGEELTPREVQKFKRDMYRDIDWENRDRTAMNQADIDVAQAARGALEDLSPELGAVNREWGRLLDLEEVLVPAMNRIENRHAGPAAWMSGFSQPLWLVQEGGRMLGKAAPTATRAVGNPAIAALSQAGWLADIVEEEPEANIPYLYD